MTKIKFHFLFVIIPFLVIGIMAIPTKSAKAETTTTTFPVDEAGIAAYVKLDSVDITDLTEALNYFYQRKKQESTYVIGTMQIENKMGRWVPLYSYPHLYIGLDGWMVAYYLNTEEVAKIMQWKGYSSGVLNTTVLKDAIDTMSAKVGVTYSTPIKYYDFVFPEANKMTVVVETTDKGSDSFSVTIPGTLYEASYSLHGNSVHPSCCWWGTLYGTIYLQVDGVNVFSSDRVDRDGIYYGFYDVSVHLEPNEPHFVTFYSYENPGGVATVLIYKN